MSGFAERYEAACQRDGTLRAVADYPMFGKVDLHFGTWGAEVLWWWQNQQGDRTGCDDLDAIAHATVAMLRWLCDNDWMPQVHQGTDGNYCAGLLNDDDVRIEHTASEISVALMGAVENVLDGEAGMTIEAKVGARRWASAGEFLHDELLARKWPVEHLAREMCVDVSIVEMLIDGRLPMTEGHASMLGEALGTSAGLWMSIGQEDGRCG